MSNNAKNTKAIEKKTPGKLTLRRLEDRIAPRMVGTEMVYPSMADAAADPSYYYSDPSCNYTNSTEWGKNKNGLAAEQADAQDAGRRSSKWHGMDWAIHQHDGSLVLKPPQSVKINNGVISVPRDEVNRCLSAFPGVSVLDGGRVCIEFHQDVRVESNTVIIPTESRLREIIPRKLPTYENQDGSLAVVLPVEGIKFSDDSRKLIIDRVTVNEIFPWNIRVLIDGSVEVNLPEGVKYTGDGSVYLSPRSVYWLGNPLPKIFSKITWARYNTDGSVSCRVPSGTMIENRVLIVPFNNLSVLPIPAGVNINNDGSVDLTLPGGAVYDPQENSVTLPSGFLKSRRLRVCLKPNYKSDGSVTINLQDGTYYNSDTNCLRLDNVLANKSAPDVVAIEPDGTVIIQLPRGTEFKRGGEFKIPRDQLNFLSLRAPDYIHDVPFSVCHGDGSYTINPPRGWILSGSVIKIENKVITRTLPMPEGVTIMSDGTMQIRLSGSMRCEDGVILIPSGTIDL
ncbi:MAG: hypothetical protein AABZ06_15300, partial [Bdellovibrionota bacterium]